MAQQRDTLFDESSQGAVSAVTAGSVVLSVLLMFGGMVLSSYAFGSETPNFFVFTAGLVATVLGFVVPFAVLPAIGK